MKLFQAYLYLIISLSLTTTSPLVAKYAKTRCNDKCGNVTIPYPFGVGASCSLNQWYTIDCSDSTPYLTSLNHLELLGVNLRYQTVRVSMPKVSACQNPVKNSSEIMGVNLGASPFLFSRSNYFVFEGCGSSAMMMDNVSSVVTGCSTTCLNMSFSDGNSCLGNSCCQTTIPYNFKSYKINLIGFEREGNDGACGSAFLVEDTSYDDEEGRIFASSIFRNTTFTPVSLLWTLKDSDQITCCDKDTPTKLKVDMFGRPVDTLTCLYNEQLSSIEDILSSIEDNPYLIDGCPYKVHTPTYAKTGCSYTCGNVRIPYPFGIGVRCSANQWYTVDCNSSKPYLPALNHLELMSINLRNKTVIVSMPKITNCQNNPGRNSNEIMGVDLGGSPYIYSKFDNKFVFKGCGNAIVIMDDRSVLTACSTACHGVTLNGENNCFGIGDCCETTIPYSFKSYNINITSSLKDEDEGCASAFLVDQTSYDLDGFSIRNTHSFIPVSLQWILGYSDQVTCCQNFTPFKGEVIMFNGTKVNTLTCYSPLVPLKGSPYLIGGCMDTNSNVPLIGENDRMEKCRGCEASGGYCTKDVTYDVGKQGFIENFICYHKKRISVAVILGVSISMGILFLVGFSYVLYKWINKTKEKRQRKRFFKRNGGLLLKQQEEADPSLVDKTIHFTSRELQKATDNFNENRILGRGGQGTVYKGMLVDGRIVAVKKSKVVDESQLEQFINEVLILSQINHRNVVKLLGCCLETDVPTLVSEFIPNGTLYDRLHNCTGEFPMSLNTRLQIATEVASALAYLHSATSIPIYHRDIKTTNILLDEKYRAKVSDFGTSKFVSTDQTHLTTLVKGTFGYLDPEYFQSSQFTEKSDVYSFGVVLVELLTGERPISRTRFGENRSLATHFMLAMEEERVMSVFDSMVIKEGTREELLTIAKLAMQCLNMSGKHRPTMKDVAIELETIRRSHIPSMVQTNIGSVVYGEELAMTNYWESSTTLLSLSDSITL